MQASGGAELPPVTATDGTFSATSRTRARRDTAHHCYFFSLPRKKQDAGTAVPVSRSPQSLMFAQPSIEMQKVQVYLLCKAIPARHLLHLTSRLFPCRIWAAISAVLEGGRVGWLAVVLPGGSQGSQTSLGDGRQFRNFHFP